MARTTSSTFSTADRFMVGAFAAYAMFVVGYTVTRVSFIQPEATPSDTEVNVVPHQGELWRGFAE